MKFDIPRIVKQIHLADYALEFGELVVDVHVNPARGLLVEWDELQRAYRQPDADLRQYNEGVNRVLGLLWGWTPEEVDAFGSQAMETDPELLGWLVQRTFELIQAHRGFIKKN